MNSSAISLNLPDGVLDRIMRYTGVNDLSKPKGAKKVMAAIERIQSFGNAPSFDEGDYVENENAKNLLKLLISGRPFSWKMVNWELAKGLLIQKNEALLKEVREELQRYFLRLSGSDQKQVEILMGNLLAIYPFFEPGHHSHLTLPQKINDAWVMVEYEVDLLPMTPAWKGDPYYAIGLRALDNADAVPHLIFMGTPPPTTRGAAHAEFTDFVPGHCVGETLYEEGKQIVEGWVEAQGAEKVQVYGQSLGGGLALLLATRKAVGKVYAYNPPSIGAKETLCPEINLYCQENDPVYSIGEGWNPTWNVYRVLPERPPNFYEAHIGVFAGQKRVLILKMTPDDIEAHNTSLYRRIYNFGISCLKIPLFAIKGLALGWQIVKHNIDIRERQS